jgi:hypothetical protein
MPVMPNERDSIKKAPPPALPAGDAKPADAGREETDSEWARDALIRSLQAVIRLQLGELEAALADWRRERGR